MKPLVELTRQLLSDLVETVMLNREQQQRLRDNRRDRRALNEKLALHMSLLRSARQQIGVVNAQLRSSASKYRGGYRNAEGEAPMPWRNPVRYPFDKTSIILNAPNGSGVYALRNEHTWIYVGESKDILAQLIQHLNGDSVCLAIFPSLTFSYELLPEIARTWRVSELIREFCPVCQPSLG